MWILLCPNPKGSSSQSRALRMSENESCAPCSFSWSLNPELCHLGMLESFSSVAKSFRTETKHWDVCCDLELYWYSLHCVCCVLLCLYDSRVDANTDTYSAFRKSWIYTYDIKPSAILSANALGSGSSNRYFKGDTNDHLPESENRPGQVTKGFCGYSPFCGWSKIQPLNVEGNVRYNYSRKTITTITSNL